MPGTWGDEIGGFSRCPARQSGVRGHGVAAGSSVGGGFRALRASIAPTNYDKTGTERPFDALSGAARTSVPGMGGLFHRKTPLKFRALRPSVLSDPLSCRAGRGAERGQEQQATRAPSITAVT